jgi:hypothetical protein
MSDIVEHDVPVAPVPEGYPTHVPEFATEEEERAFWASHSSAPYFYEGEDVTHRPPPEMRQGPGPEGSRALKRPQGERMTLLTLRMHEEMIAAVKAVAARRHLPYQTLMRSWIAERLEQEQRALDSHE